MLKALSVPHAENVTPTRTHNQRGLDGLTILFVILLLALVLFLLLPLEAFSVQPALVTMQAQWRAALILAMPMLVVGALGAMVGLAEISATFPTYPREALQTRWARILLLVNLLAAVFAFWLVRAYAPNVDLIMAILGVGIGFQAIIRTRFTLAKQIGGSGGGDVSLNLGWLYDQFQNLCKNQIDMELMRGRRNAVTRLMDRFPTLAELHDIATYTILARATLTTEEEKARLADLDKLLDPKAPANFARASMALMILEHGGQAYVELLLEPPAVEQITPESVVKLLIEKYALNDLVARATRLLTLPAEQEYAQKIGQVAAGAPEAASKAAIANLLVQRLGVPAVLREIGEA